ncbi:hypothetical protein ACFX1X_009808 [Malus domestica]
MPKSIPRRPLRVKFDSHLEILPIIKSNKVDSATKVVHGPIPLATEIGSHDEKDESTSMGSCEKSTKPISEECTDICELLKLDFLEDMEVCAKLVAGLI